MKEQKIYDQTLVIGQMDNSIDHTFESANRVYGKQGICPAIQTCAGGGLQPKVVVHKAKVVITTKVC